MPGLSVADVVNVQVTLTPVAAPTRNFGILCIVGPTEGVIDTSERLRFYTTIGGVTNDFGTTTPEYLAANLFFEQSPQPSVLYVGRWAQNATKAYLHGGTVSVANQVITGGWSIITNGSIAITIDGVLRSLTGLNFGAAANMNGVAAVIQTALPAGATCKWNASFSRFDVAGIATGTSGTITYASAVGSGTDISVKTGLTAAGGASAPVPGIVAETALQAATALETISNDWYGLTFAPTVQTDITDAQHIAIANFIEAASPYRIYGISSSSAAIVDATQTGDLASQLQALNLTRTFGQYSSSNQYAVCSMFGRAFTVNFNASNSTITLMFKQEPGVAAELLNESQAAAALAKNWNVFVTYNNTIAIIQPGIMSGGIYFDDRHNTDWLQNRVQTDLFNVLYTTPTKIPQTDDGVHILKTTVENSIAAGIVNGMVAPGQWNGPPIGQLLTGQMLSKGFYTYSIPISTQSQSDRQKRIAPPIQAAIKMAGAVHHVDCILNVNR